MSRRKAKAASFRMTSPYPEAHVWRIPTNIKIRSARILTAIADWVTRSTFFRSSRSAIDPPIGPRKKEGMNWAKPASPTQKALPVSSKRTKGTARFCSQVPEFEIRAPVKKMRKSRWRNARIPCANPLGIAAPGPVPPGPPTFWRESFAVCSGLSPSFCTIATLVRGQRVSPHRRAMLSHWAPLGRGLETTGAEPSRWWPVELVL